MVTRFYHTRDPIANLRVSVTVRKVAVGHTRDNGVAVGAHWSGSFQWQEKKWPLKSARRKPKKLKATAGADHEEQEEDTAAASSDARLHGIALCSYVDADNYEPPRSAREAPTTSLAPPPHVYAGAADVHVRKTAAASALDTSGSAGASSNRDRVALRAHREERFRQMHLVLRISHDDDGRGGDGDGEDLVLASLRFYTQTGLLCATPGFSVCVVDENDAQSTEKGSQLSTYRVTSRVSGAQFEYALDNENELWPVVSAEDQRLLRELQRQDQCEERARVEEWRNKHGDAVTMAAMAAKRVDKCDAETGHDELLVLLEVVAVSGVDAPDPIRVSLDALETDAATDAGTWALRHGKRRCCSHLSRVVMRDVAHPYAAIGLHTQFAFRRLVTATPTASTRVPPLQLTVVSLDGWGRERLHGHAEMQLPVVAGFADTELALWRPMLPPQAQMEAFFLGYEREDAAHAFTSAASVGAAAPHVLTRLGARTESTSGRVRVRYHVVHSRPSLAVQPDKMAPPLPPRNALHTGGVVKRSVEEILQSVKASQSASRAGTLAPLTLPSPSVSAILARLKDQSNRGTSPSAG